MYEKLRTGSVVGVICLVVGSVSPSVAQEFWEGQRASLTLTLDHRAEQHGIAAAPQNALLADTDGLAFVVEAGSVVEFPSSFVLAEGIVLRGKHGAYLVTDLVASTPGSGRLAHGGAGTPS